MNLPPLLAAPGPMLFIKWTCLLAMGWVAHAGLRHRHARWRLILWRSLLCAGLALPLASMFELPGIKIPVSAESAQVRPADNTPPVAASQTTAAPVPVANATVLPKTATQSVASSIAPVSIPHRPLPWAYIIMAVWAAGCGIGAIRLGWLQFQLSRLRAAAQSPSPELQQLAIEARARLGLRREIPVRLSDAVVSPFVCGVLKPVIILPHKLVQDLSPGALTALLSHELAHLRRHDLAWCIGWRWVKVAFWFHPLVWGIPAAHNLACEQEADRLAAGEGADSYARLLATLALRIVAVPAVEMRLTVNGSSQIVRRLNYLGRHCTWNRKYAFAGFALAAAMFLGAAGCAFVKNDTHASAAAAHIQFKTIPVEVQDEEGNPIAGATIEPDGFRVKGIHGADAYGWNKKLFGPAENAVTDAAGRALVKYPDESIPEEKEYTGALILIVSHPDFVSLHVQTYMVDGTEKPIHLQRGLPLRVSAWYGADREPVTNLVLNLGQEMIRSNDWSMDADGNWNCHKILPGSHLIQAMGELPTGEIVFSEATPFAADQNTGTVISLEMKPGIRVEGRLDDSVPRPVKNGRVLIAVRPPQFPAWNNYADMKAIFEKYHDFRPWNTYRTVAEDGTFVFESVPPGGLDIIAHGDGFISKSGADFVDKYSTGVKKVKGFALPQAFDLTAPVTQITVVTEPTATFEATARDRAGKPVKGATFYLSPNIVRMGGIFGWAYGSSEEPFRTIAPLPKVPYSATTDENGIAVIRNVPAFTSSMEMEDADYQVPLQEPKGWRDRDVRLEFAPGETNHFAITLERKGADYIGSR